MTNAALVSWMRPNEAWLLELYGPCWPGFTPAMRLDSHHGMDRRSMQVDSCVRRSRPTSPCRIADIRVDVRHQGDMKQAQARHGPRSGRPAAT